MFIKQEEVNNYTLVDKRAFDDVECPLGGPELEVAKKLVQDYTALQIYLREVYALMRQCAYAAANNKEVPKCIREAANSVSLHKKLDTDQLSSTK